MDRNKQKMKTKFYFDFSDIIPKLWIITGIAWLIGMVGWTFNILAWNSLPYDTETAFFYNEITGYILKSLVFVYPWLAAIYILISTIRRKRGGK